MDRKGQAAMEFLMTYGWAILAAIIAIGVLAYFGVFSPGRFVQDSVTLNAPFNARAATVNTSTVQIELLNGGGETFNIINISITNCNTTAMFNRAHPTGNISIYAFPCGGFAFTSGDTFKGDITILYNRTGSALSQQSTGSITSRVR